MNSRKKAGSLLVVALSLLPATLKAEISAYPKKGQSEKQQSTDKASCAKWATQQTGIDPEQLTTQSQQAPSAPSSSGGALKGGGKGAAVGALGGAVTGNAGAGAAIGAGVGAVAGAEKESKEKKQAQSEVQKQLDSFEKAQKACLEGKGYTVS